MLTEFIKVENFWKSAFLLKLGVTSWYQSGSLSEPLAIGVGRGLRLEL
jgi:hypothetical protein